MKTLLKNGLVYDGTGEKPEKKDILIHGEKIIEVGPNISTEKAEKVVDLEGQNISPGFIDAHSHNDFFATEDDHEISMSSFMRQGITTQITGNCGFSVIGVDSETPHKKLIGGGLFHTTQAGSLKEWAHKFKDKVDVNIVPLVGHGSTRISVAGYSSEELTREEQQKMLSLLERDLQDGAWGGSLGLMYEPGMYSKKEELIKFAEVVKKYDGILTVHPRACSNISNGFPLYKLHHLELGLDEVGEIMERTGVRTQYSHLIFTGKKSWPRLNSMLSKIHGYKDKGYDIGYDMYSYTYGASVITIMLPPDYLATPKEKRGKGFPYIKAKVLMNLTKSLLGLDFDVMTIAYLGEGYEKYEGKTVTEIAKEEGLKPPMMYLKLVELSNGQGRVYIDNYYNEHIIKTLMEDDLSIFMTDAWQEENGLQNASAYTCYPNFFLLGEKNNIPKEKIINKMTGAIADRFQIPKRGYIKEGYYADLTVFNNWSIEKADEYPKGLHSLYINGKQVLEGDNVNKIQAGKILLREK